MAYAELNSYPFPTKNEPPMRGSLTLPEFVPKTKGSRFGAMILEIKTGRKRTKSRSVLAYAKLNCHPFPTKKRTSHERFVNTSGVRSENRRFPIWRNDFGAKNGAQAKQRVEAYWHTRNSTVIRSQQKNEPPMRGSLTLPEFVPKTADSRFGAMILELKTGRKRNGGLKRIEHTRKSPSSVPHKKRTSHERFVSTFGVRSENRRFQIWRNDFGAKNGAQAKQRIETY